MGLRATQRNWELFARTDPLWAILTDSSKRGNRWSAEEFFATGRDDVALVLEQLAEAHVAVNRGRALDFGCGIGRLSQALAAEFASVTGVDISPTMIELAREHNRAERVQYILNSRPDLSCLPGGHFDFVLSLIALQHVPRRNIVRYLREFARVLAPGGVAVFQVPSRMAALPRSRLSRLRLRAEMAAARLYHRWLRRDQPFQDMFGVPVEKVIGLLSDAGLELLDVRMDRAAGREWLSFRYTARKPQPLPAAP